MIKHDVKSFRHVVTDIYTYPDYDIDIYFVGIDDDLWNLGRKILTSLENEGKKTKDASEDFIDPDLDKKCRVFYEKYIVVLKLLSEDEELRNWCQRYSVYSPVEENNAIKCLIYNDSMKQVRS